MKKLLSMALCMVFTLFPTAAFAAVGNTNRH